MNSTLGGEARYPSDDPLVQIGLRVQVDNISEPLQDALAALREIEGMLFGHTPEAVPTKPIEVATVSGGLESLRDKAHDVRSRAQRIMNRL